MINSFPVKRSYHAGGYASFQFVPVRLIAAYPMINNGSAVVPLQFYGGSSWFKGYATRGTLLYREEPQTDPNGTYYNRSLTGLIPGDSPELITLLGSMTNERFVLLVRDVFGAQRLVGTPIAPLDFNAVYDSGSQMSDEKGFRFTFSGAGLSYSPYYTG
jgi:hypothetical protein